VGPGGPLRWGLITTMVVAGAWVCAYHDIRISTQLMLVAELISTAALLLILGWAMVRSGHWLDPAQFRLPHSHFAGIQLALVLVSTTLAGFESATTLGEEAKGARRSIPRAMLLSLIPTGILYLSCTYCLVYLSRLHHVAIDQATLPFQVLADVVGLSWAGGLSSVGIVISCAVCSIAGLNAGSRIVFAMARDGLMPARLAAVHPVHATPVRALQGLGIFAVAAPLVLFVLGVSLTSCMDLTIQMDSLGYLGSYLVVCVAAPFFLWRERLFTFLRLSSAAGAFLALGALVVVSLFPLPAAPWCYLPLAFIALMGVGLGVSLKPRSAAVGARILRSQPAADRT